jgi:nicotinate-nucleotide adenylyltransferase
VRGLRPIDGAGTPSPAALRASTSPLRGEVKHAPGLKVGLLGGSFDPPHQAHRAVTLFAMTRLGLDRAWWLVTPGNPLKDTRRLPPLDARVTAARRLAAHPRIEVTALEAAIGTRFTSDTIAWLTRRFPAVRFVWIMGADNLAQFDRWRNWRAIAARMPIAVVDRFGASLAATGATAARALAAARIRESDARSLPYRRPPAWVYLHGIKLPLSSTAIRAQAPEGPRRRVG